MYLYYKYSYNLRLKKANICEVGFLYGVSSLTFFLSTGLSSKYLGFDYGLLQSRHIFSLLEKYFNMQMIWGKSQNTVPLFNESIKCDIVHLDGSHDKNLIFLDIQNMKRLSHNRTILMIDDVYDNNYAWKKALHDEIIKEIYCSKHKPFCIGLYK